MTGNLGVPTNWQQMQYCIVAALHVIGDNPNDRDEIYTSAIQFEITQMFNFRANYVDFDMVGAYGKAFDRALASLKEDGTVIADDLGYRLVSWGPREEGVTS